MQTISQAAKLLADHYGFVTLRAYLDGTQVTAELGKGVYTASVGGDELTIGNACAASMTLTVNDALPGIGGKALSITWAVDATEYPLFTGIVEDPVVRAGQTTITAYDAMYYGGADAFSPSAELLADVLADRALTLIGTAMGVSVAQEALTLAAGVTIPGGFSGVREDISNAQAAGYVAAILGGNALIDREGNLTVRRYAAVSWETEVYSGGADAKNKDFTVTGVTFRRTDTVTVINADGTTSETEATTTYEAGDGTLAMDNPLCDQAAATRAYAALAGVTVRAGSYGYPAGIQIEPGDIITARSMDGSYQVAATSITMTLDGGVKTDLRSGGAPPSGGASGPISQALKVLQADIAHIRQLVAENADINSANIGTLQAEWANIGTAIINTLQANGIEAGWIKTGMGGNLYPVYDSFEQVTNDTLYFYKEANATPAVISSQYARHGGKVLRIVTASGATNAWVSLGAESNNYGQIRLEPGRYVASAYFRRYNTATSVGVRLNVIGKVNRDSSFATGEWSRLAYTDATLSATKWTRVEVPFTVGDNPTYPFIHLRPSVLTGDVTVYVDCLQIEAVEEGQTAGEWHPAGTTTIDGGNITTGTIDASRATITNINASNITSGALTVTDSNNNVIFSANKTNKSVTMGGWSANNGYLSSTNTTTGNELKLGNGQISGTEVRLLGDNGDQMPTLKFYPSGGSTSMLSISSSGNSMAGYTATIASATDLQLLSSKALILATGGGVGPAGYAGIVAMDAIIPAYTNSYSLGTNNLRWNWIHANTVMINGYPAVAKRTKTVTGTTTAAGNISLGVDGGTYGILSVKRTDANSICTPYVYHGTSADTWYAHITNIAASPAAVTNTSVTLEVDYYEK